MPSEYEIKAVWLLNCARFVDWPGRSFADAQSPFVIGVVGKDPFGKHLDKAFEGKVVKGRTFIVKRLFVDQNLKDCHILFVSATERKRTRNLLARLKGVPVLTVGETDEFLDQGGMVQFVRKDETICVAVNLEPAQRASVYLIANLLKVAVSVRGKYE
jgi:YfiR/HmsC-like